MKKSCIILILLLAAAPWASAQNNERKVIREILG